MAAAARRVRFVNGRNRLTRRSAALSSPAGPARTRRLNVFKHARNRGRHEGRPTVTPAVLASGERRRTRSRHRDWEGGRSAPGRSPRASIAGGKRPESASRFCDDRAARLRRPARVRRASPLSDQGCGVRSTPLGTGQQALDSHRSVGADHGADAATPWSPPRSPKWSFLRQTDCATRTVIPVAQSRGAPLPRHRDYFTPDLWWEGFPFPWWAAFAVPASGAP
jgi:hypothetical protein